MRGMVGTVMGAIWSAPLMAVCGGQNADCPNRLSDRAMTDERWDNDDNGKLDDIVVPDVRVFHMERMDAEAWWIGLTRADGSVVHIDICIEDGPVAHVTINVTRREV